MSYLQQPLEREPCTPDVSRYLVMGIKTTGAGGKLIVLEEASRIQSKDKLGARYRYKAILGPSVLPLGLTQVEEGRKLVGRGQALSAARSFIACVCQGRCEQLSSHTDVGSQSP